MPPVLNKRELASLCRQHQTLIDSAKPILDMLEVSIRDTGYIAILAVASGHLLAAVATTTCLCRRGANTTSRRAEEHQDHWGVGAVHEHRGACAHPDNQL